MKLPLPCLRLQFHKIIIHFSLKTTRSGPKRVATRIKVPVCKKMARRRNPLWVETPITPLLHHVTSSIAKNHVDSSYLTIRNHAVHMLCLVADKSMITKTSQCRKGELREKSRRSSSVSEGYRRSAPCCFLHARRPPHSRCADIAAMEGSLSELRKAPS